MHDLEALTPLMSAAANDASGTVARALFAHLADGWHRLERFRELEIAVVEQGRDPGSRTKPPRPYGDEPRKLMDDFWFWRLRQRAIVPTTHGPRRADEAWLPSTEIDRLFRRGRRAPGEFVPVVDLGSADVTPAAKRLAAALDIRPDITPSNFGPDDANVLTERLVTLYGPAVEAGTLDEDQLRTVVRQTYRSMFSLLSGSSKEHDTPPLADAPLLVSDGDGSYHFVPGSATLYSDSGGARERLASERPLWLFVVEAYPAATAPIQRIFGARLLRRALSYVPKCGEPTLDEPEMRRFRNGLDSLLPYLLARLQAERSEREQAQTDANRLRKLIASIEPVDDLALSVSLDGEVVARAEERSSYTQVRPRGDITSFVRWGTNGWPPTPEEAQALSSALADSLELNSMFEPFMALVQAPSDDARKRLLQLAGAPTDLVDVLEVAREDEAPEDRTAGGPEPIVVTTAPGADPADTPVAPPVAPSPTNGHVPLYAPGQLLIEGTPIIETPGIQPSEPEVRKQNGHSGGNGSHPRMVGLRTDIDRQDALGMYVAMSFELNRLRQAGAPIDTEMVFDVSDPGLLAEARTRSAGVEGVVQMLAREGVSHEWPGFDILTLDPLDPTSPGRLIELKSSGHNARTQDMTWNEWKTARRGQLREYFYLYLVGNLRSDLGGAMPFVRAIHDPFMSILSQQVSHVTKSVQLDLRQFERAEYQELTVVETKAVGGAGASMSG